MTTEHDDTDFEPPQGSSPTDHVLNELHVYGYRPVNDEPDQPFSPRKHAF